MAREDGGWRQPGRFPSAVSLEYGHVQLYWRNGGAPCTSSTLETRTTESPLGVYHTSPNTHIIRVLVTRLPLSTSSLGGGIVLDGTAGGHGDFQKAEQYATSDLVGIRALEGDCVGTW